MKGDFIIDTVTVGLMCMAEAVIPVVTWFTYQHDRPSVMVFDKDTNDWYYIAWYVMWIGHLVAFAAPAVLWIPSYFSSCSPPFSSLCAIWSRICCGDTVSFLHPSFKQTT